MNVKGNIVFLVGFFGLILSSTGQDLEVDSSATPILQKQTVRRKTIPFIRLDSAGERVDTDTRFTIDPDTINTGLSSYYGQLKNLNSPGQTKVVSNLDTLVWSTNNPAPLYLIFFRDKGRPAPPPMVTGNYTNPYLNPSWTKKLDPNIPFVLERPGLYYIQTDTLGTEGYGVISLESSFPKPEQITDVVDPLIYINSSAERNDLMSAPDKRRAFENFWISLAGNQTNARLLIREYYRRVSHTNQYYTSHKLGWKTDRGIVYIIFGPPNEIRRLGSRLSWVYMDENGTPDFIFEFERKNDFFSKNHYVLERNSEYKELWNQQVSQWRVGRI